MTIESMANEQEQTEPVAPVQERSQSRQEAVEAFYSQYPEGLSRDLHRVLHQNDRLGYVKSSEAPVELRELLEEVSSKVANQKTLPTIFPEVVATVINLVDQHGWSYDEYNMDQIKEALREKNIELTPDRTSRDYH